MVGIIKDTNWSLSRNTENIVEYYRKPLNDLLKGESIVDTIPKGTRKTLLQLGIIYLYGSKYMITNYGKELLKKSYKELMV